MTSKTGAALLLILTFVLGMVAGGIVHCLYQKQIAQKRTISQARRPSIEDDITQTVGLDSGQQELLRTILSNRMERFRALDAALRQETRQQIRQILRDDQKPKFEQLIQKWDNQQKAWEKAHRDGNSPRPPAK